MFCIIVVHFTEMLFFQECACQFVGFMHENETKDINSVFRLFETNLLIDPRVIISPFVIKLGSIRLVHC